MAGSLEGIQVKITFSLQGSFVYEAPYEFTSVTVGAGAELVVPLSARILSDTDGDGDMEPVQGPNGLLSGTMTVDISGNQVFAQFEGTAQPAGFTITIEGLAPAGAAPGTITDEGSMNGVNAVNAPTYNASTKTLTYNWSFWGFQPGTKVDQTVFYDNMLEDTPDAVDDAFSAKAGVLLTGKSVLANDTDLDNGGSFGVVDQQTVTAINGVAAGVGQWVDLVGGGRVLLNGDGTLQFSDGGDFADLTARQTRATSFQYTVTDSTGRSDTATTTFTVEGVNDAPTAVNLTQSKVAVEDGGAVPLDNIVVTDADAGETVTATLTLNLPQAGSLSVGTFGAATATYNSSTGVWTVTGSVADVNAALAAVAFAPAPNWDRPVSITTQIRDAAGAGPANGTITVNVSGINDAPTATQLVQNKSFAEDPGGSIALDNIVVTDIDTGETVTATLTLSNPAAGSLTVGTYGSATSTFDAGTGVWTVTGSVSDVNAALAAVAFTPAANWDQSFTITTRIRDSANTGPADGTIAVTVTPVNDAPTAVSMTQGKTFVEDASSPVALDNIVVSDVDPGETITATLTLSTPAAGSLSAGTYGSATATYNAGTGVWTVTGSAADVNAALAAVTFTSAAGWDKNVTIATRIRDAANVGPADGTITLIATPVNDAPAIGTNLGASTVTGGLFTLTSGQLSANDPDDLATGLTYTVTDATDYGTLFRDGNGNGVIDGGEALGINSTFTQNDIDQGRIKYLHGGGADTGDSFTFSLADGGEDGAAPVTGRTFDIAVSAKPIITKGGAPTPTHAEGGAATIIAPTLTVADSDSPMLTGATLVVTDFVAGDVLGFAAVDGITGSYNAAAGVLTLSGTATVAAYQAVLRTLTYSTTSDNPTVGVGNADRVISVKVADGSGLESVPASITLNVVATNDAPVLDVSQSSTLKAIAEDIGNPTDGSTANGTLVSALLGGMTDVDVGALQGIAVVGVSTHGTLWCSTDGGVSWDQVSADLSATSALVLHSDARLYFQPAANFHGTVADAITFKAWDRTDGRANGTTGVDTTHGSAFSTGTDTASVNIISVNDSPALADTPLALNPVAEDSGSPDGPVGTLVSSLTGGISDADSGDARGIAIVGADASQGTWFFSTDNGAHWMPLGMPSADAARLLLGDAGTRVYFQPAADYQGTVPAALTIRAWDGTAGTNGGTANTGSTGGTTAFSPTADTVSVTVTPANDAPIATVPSSLSVTEDTPTALTGISFADVDAGSGAVTVTMSVPAGVLIATSGAGVTVGGTASALTLTGTIADINAFIAGSGVTYTPAPNDSGTRVLTISIDDGGNNGSGGALSDTRTVSLNVSAVNDAPVIAAPATIEAHEDARAALTGISFSDADAGPGLVTVTFSAASGSLAASDGDGVNVGEFASALTLTGTIADINAFIASGNLTFLGADNASGNVKVTVTIDDGGNTGAGGAKTDTADFDIVVAPVNDAPIGQDKTISLLEDSTYRFSAADFGFSDPVEGDAFSFIEIVSLPEEGVLTLLDLGTGTTRPVVVGDIIPAASLDGGKLGYTPAANSHGAALAGFAFRVTDSGGTDNGGSDTSGVHRITFDVAPVNDAPTAQDKTVTLLEDDSYTFKAADFGFADIEGHGLKAVTVVTLPQSGTLTLNGHKVVLNQSIAASEIGKLVFTPATDMSGEGLASFNFRVQDTGGTANGGVDTSAQHQMRIDVAPVNDAPAAQNRTVSLQEDRTRSLTAADFGFSDALDGHSLKAIIIAGLPQSGTLTLNGRAVVAGQSISAGDIGKLAFTPAKDANGSGYATIRFKVQDDGGTAHGGQNTSREHTLTVDVTPVNDAPTIGGVPAGLAITDKASGKPFTNVIVSDADGMGTVLTATISLDKTGTGTLTRLDGFALNSDGSYSITGTAAQVQAALRSLVFVPKENGGKPGQPTSTTISVTIGDGEASVTRNVPITVQPVNDRPTLANDGPVVVVENGTASANARHGVLANDTDPDRDVLAVSAVAHGHSREVAAGTAIIGTYGRLTLKADGSYTYVANTTAAEALRAGAIATDTFSYTVSDGQGGTQTATLSFRVSGTNDSATFGGTSRGMVMEDGVLFARGTLTTLDADAGQTGFRAQADQKGVYGTFAFDAATGTWTYALDNKAKATQALRQGETKTETFTVKALDGTVKTVTVTVTGSGEAVDGAEVETVVTTNPDGSQTQRVAIMPITADRGETGGNPMYADVPLVSVGGSSVLTAQLGVGIGLVASGFVTPKPAGSSVADLIREIRAHTAAGSSDQASLTGSGAGFLASLPTNVPLIVQTLLPTIASGSTAPAQPLVISGSPAANAPQTALVIDTRGLPSGSHIELQNVDFAAVIGAVTITGGAGSQVVYGDGAGQHIVLGADDDTLHGGGGNDYVGSHGGNDWLYGDAGNDTVSGGIGNDRLYGGSGHDRLLGETGHDRLSGDTGNDTLDGGTSNDSLWGGSGNDRLIGGSGNDGLYGDTGDDRLEGGTGHDRLDGGTGNDLLYGNAENDTLLGGEGNDSLKGDGGNDWIVGGLGQDKLWGGAGADVFDFNAVQESRAGAQRDVIYDFQSGVDRIDLRGIDANVHLKGDQAFTWVGANAPFLYPKETAALLKLGFTGKAGQLRFEDGILSGDTNGDRKADFQIKIVGHFSHGDVIL
ncbi:Ig-like domain-containing protein [Microvirga pakistanensis]|uniref:Ig-like domain-containing protein n=1 Tax=Microvirga pakistanensis TaxID=1682650 RepID=UPI0010692CEF|nr:Ig-like domain-containing protein [Microvirga pakistanensis]